jgi:hypothetical protein
MRNSFNFSLSNFISCMCINGSDHFYLRLFNADPPCDFFVRWASPYITRVKVSLRIYT